MADRPPVPSVDRRAFLNGRLSARTHEHAADFVEIASVLVHVRPERLDAVARAIEMLPGSEIHGRSPQGKLAVVIQADHVGDIGATLNAISSIPHVLTAALVFHATDEG